MKDWALLILGLPTANSTERMRAWRTLKACGAAVLRDGVYLLPTEEAELGVFEAVERDVLAVNGTALLLSVREPLDRFQALFDRSDAYAELRDEVAICRSGLTPENAMITARQARKLRKGYAQLVSIDFFPGTAKQQTDVMLQALETAISRALSPDEPSFLDEPIHVLDRQDYQGRVWATRKRPWVDRLASAWLICRFIDPGAQMLWLDHPGDCPAHALGFDFDSATFSHVGQRVTFETLVESFSLQAPGLERLAAVVHYLDVGGIQPPEAVGIERVLAGLREAITDDDQLLLTARGIFDGLLTAFASEENTHG
ncbi:chromate resistance protein ChrB domain-containing protein [Pseudomonas monteilii]|nr:chromate resistance protein ChrB domain-containing protein [Pseudomonas monteilii]